MSEISTVMVSPTKCALYWKGSGEVDPVLVKSLEDQGLSVQIIGDCESIADLKGIDSIEILAIDLVGSESSAADKLLTLSTLGKRIASVKILILGRLSDDRFRSLTKTFPKLEVLQTPISENSIRSISWLKAAKNVHKPNATDSSSNTISVLRVKSLYNGNTFAVGSAQHHFENSAISAFPKLVSVFNRIWKSNPKSALRGQRVAASATALAKAIGLSEKKQTDLAQAAFFLHGLSGENQKGDAHVEYDFFLLPKSNQLTALSNVYQETSVIVANELGLPEAARYISELSEQLNRASRNESPGKVSDSIGCLLIPELAERSVWQQGRWDRYALSRMMRKLLEGKFFSFSSDLIVAFGKMVAEAFGLRLLVHPEAAKIYESKLPFSDELVSEAEEKASGQLDGRIVTLLPVDELKAGMTLLAPIVTQDGVLLLRSDIILDDGIISCLKDLAKVRPLRSLISVEKIGISASHQ